MSLKMREWDDRAMVFAMSRKRLLLAAAVVGLATGGAVMGHARAAEPKRVTGASFVLDTLRTGNQIGAAEAYALANSAAGSALPARGTFGPADPVVQQVAQQALIAASSQGSSITKVTEAGDAGIVQAQNAVQPLAALNAGANQVVDAGAAAANTAAQALGPQIQPFDTTVKETAQFVRQLEAPPGG
jgi:hypothetical protein